MTASSNALDDAFANKDADTIKSLMTPDHITVAPYYDGPQTVDDQLASLAEYNWRQTIVGDVNVALLAPDVALRTFTADLKGTFKGKTLPSQVFATELLVKRDKEMGGALLSGHHAQALTGGHRLYGQKEKRDGWAGWQTVTREELAKLLNEDLSREYQAIIAYVVYSQVLRGAEYMSIAAQLEEHAHQELQHALTLSRQIDYLGAMPSVTPKPVKTSSNARDMLRFALDNENETIINYQDRVRQCEALGEFALAEQIREILVQEQDHQIDLATALGEEVPDLSRLRERKG